MDWYRRAHASPDTPLSAARKALAGRAAPLRRIEEQILAVTVPSRAVFALAAALGGWALGAYYVAGITMLQGDSVGHLFIARRVIDSITPSSSEFGGIWLPLPHLLMIPTIWSDTMWHTGLSGSIISSLAFAASAVYLHRLVTSLSGSGLAGLLCAAIFATNPNMLFMQATPMVESLTLLLLVAPAFHLMRWTQTDRALHLFLSALFVFCATLTRYEAWILVPIGAGVVALTMWRAHRSWKHVEAYGLAWGAIALYGVFLWLLYSWVIFGDAINFSRGEFTGAALAADLEASGLLPYKGDPLLASATYGWAVVDNVGLPLVFVALAGSAALAVSRIPLQVKLAATLPFWVFLFHVASLTNAGSGMSTPHASPADFENTRYGLLMLPAVVIAAGAIVRPLRLLGIALLAGALLPQLLVLSGPLHAASLAVRDTRLDQAALTSQWKSANFPFLSGERPIVVTDAAHAGGFLRRTDEPGDWLRANARSGRILISASRNDAPALMMRADLDVARFVHEGNKPHFTEELEDFGAHVDWIVFQPLDHVNGLRHLFARAYPAGFQLAYDSGHFEFYEKVRPSGDISRPPGVPASAVIVEEHRLLGDAGSDPSVPFNSRHTVREIDCTLSLLTVRTSRENIFAEALCGSGLGAELTQALTNAPARIETRVGTPTTLSIEAPDRSLEVQTGRIWIEMIGKPVPAHAHLVTGDASLGALDAVAPSSDIRTVYRAACANEVFTLATNREVLYVESACAELPAGLLDVPYGQPVMVEVERSDDPLLQVRFAEASYEIHTGRAWVLPIAPPGVPEGSVALLSGMAIGGEGNTSLFVSGCAGDVLSIITSTHLLFAEAPCSYVPRLNALAGRQIAARLTVGETVALVVEAGEAGTVEVPASRVWVHDLSGLR